MTVKWVSLLGFVAAFCTTIAFLPQAIKILNYLPAKAGRLFLP